MVLVGLVHQKNQQFELIQTAGFLLDSYVWPRNIPKISATMNTFLEKIYQIASTLHNKL